MSAITRHPWRAAFVAVGALLAVLHLAGLGSAPPGMYIDESSIGYNAWAIAHTGVDEHGASFPLFFEAFGEWKNPLYIYLLAPFTLVAPLTPYLERLPAALCGLAACALVAATAYRLTRSRTVAMLALVTAGFTPWLVVESRVGFEVITMVLCLTAALWCLVHAVEQGPHARRWAIGAGVALGLALFSYSSGRALVALLVAALVLAGRGRWPRPHPVWLFIVPVAVAYLVLGGWAAFHQGALTARLGALAITADHPAAVTVVWRFVRNYIGYLNVPFLLTHGDPNPRHSTQFGGMLLVSTVPAMVAGVASCVRDWSDPLRRFALLGTLAGPVPAAYTMEGTPHSLRAAGMLPFLRLLAIYGWAELIARLRARPLVAAVLGLLVVVEIGSYSFDLFVRWPGRTLLAGNVFDQGQVDAIQRASDVAGGHRIIVSSTLEGASIDSLFVLHPDPHDYLRRGLAAAGVVVMPPAETAETGSPGDVLVLAPGDPVPPGATLIHDDQVTVASESGDLYDPARSLDLVDVYRR